MRESFWGCLLCFSISISIPDNDQGWEDIYFVVTDHIPNENWAFRLCKDVKPPWKKYLNFPGPFFLDQKLDPWVFLFVWHCFHCVINSFSLRHQNLINFEFLQKHRYLYLSLSLSCRNMELASFHGNKLWLRDAKDIFVIFLWVV